SHCSVEDYGSGGSSGNAEKALSINLNIPGSAINTYAAIDAVGGEDEVHTLYVLFFEPTTDGSGMFLEMHPLHPDENATYTSGQTIELVLPETSSLSNKQAYSLFFIANPAYYLDMYSNVIEDWNAFLPEKLKMKSNSYG
ncbi:MAG: hypothetical protein LIP01_13160, partial [Tannerellaceae bacterium]|nr:hypothetical protein [Tannerellaceae bacterium]